jgi:DNA-binding response OmpR family regulator
MFNQTTRDAPTALLIARTDELRSMLAELLVVAGYHVLPIEDVTVGVRLAPTQRVDVAVIEVSPPIDQDLSVLQGLRRHRATRRIPVVVVRTQPTTVLERDATASEVISMPFDIDDALVHVNRAAGYSGASHDMPAMAGTGMRAAG